LAAKTAMSRMSARKSGFPHKNSVMRS
jgi:hypothetical protein